jgi:hypothetical protein
VRLLRRQRERCDNLAPVEADVGMAVCVREPGHQGHCRSRYGEEWLHGPGSFDPYVGGPPAAPELVQIGTFFDIPVFASRSAARQLDFTGLS